MDDIFIFLMKSHTPQPEELVNKSQKPTLNQNKTKVSVSGMPGLEHQQ